MWKEEKTIINKKLPIGGTWLVVNSLKNKNNAIKNVFLNIGIKYRDTVSF